MIVTRSLSVTISEMMNNLDWWWLWIGLLVLGLGVCCELNECYYTRYAFCLSFVQQTQCLIECFGVLWLSVGRFGWHVYLVQFRSKIWKFCKQMLHLRQVHFSCSLFSIYCLYVDSRIRLWRSLRILVWFVVLQALLISMLLVAWQRTSTLFQYWGEIGNRSCDLRRGQASRMRAFVILVIDQLTDRTGSSH